MNAGKDISYELIRSLRRTADIVIEPDGRVIVRAPQAIPVERIEDIIESKRLWIYKNLAEWRDLNATRVIREYRNGEGFLYLGRSYRLLLVADQVEPLLLKGGRFCLRRDLVDRGEIPAAKAAFRDYFIMRKRDIPQNQGFCFAWDDAAGMHIFQGRAGGIKTAKREEKATTEARQKWEPIFEFAAENGTNGTCPVLSPEEVANAIRDMNGTKSKPKADTVKKQMQRAETLGVLRKAERGKWSINPTGQTGHERDK